MLNLEPKKRSKIRVFIGKKYYSLRRRLYWMFGKINFAKEKDSKPYTHEYFSHRTPLLRQLKDVDMYLQYNKITNLKLAVPKINDIIIKPGETFSYWKLIGKPTRRKGYKDGMILFSGTFKPGIGGGLCQLSNLIYWMVIHTPLTVAERYRHSYDVFPDSSRTQPFGSGATCVYNYRDLMIRNDTSQPYQLKVWLTDSELCGSIRVNSKPCEFYKVYEKEHFMNKELFGKYSRHNVIFRKVYNIHNKMMADEYVTENHALMMYEPFLEYKQQ
ncbi:VanW family protein [Anaerocolumna aminovalerica]|uniref:Vancomycin resistance protein VanW n=1 Tax=Anaerocolumna aminovalerica TaxID=1527 RepID=A0A1I5CMT3_9FIRM|nr:VanW family protein [Anaerocolumna aminovalerica]MBU5332505.1 VanW family protein [Anaerocolumna aminovalerica]SFN88213.1 vancomycin resistance protein VanW [Anaerocolumna aminovalerica]